MYFQKRYLEENKAFVGTSGLMTIDLPNKGYLSAIEFRVNAVVGAAAGLPDVWLHDAMTKVEVIVNGSQVVKSLTGDQLQAVSQYHHSYVDTECLYNVGAETQREHFIIDLGRFYHDIEYMLDLGRVNDPELRIHFDFTKTAANGWTAGQAFGTGTTPTISVVPHLLRDAPAAPLGYIKTSEVYRFTSAASLIENMHIPRGPMYNGLYLQSWYKNEGLERNLDHVELNFDSDNLIPFRLGRREIAADVLRSYGEFEFSETISGDYGLEYPAPIEGGKVWQNCIGGVDQIGGEGYLWANYFTIGGMLISTAAVNAGIKTLQLMYKGRYPFSLLKFPYLDALDPRTWINSATLGDIWLRVEEPAGAGTNVTIKLLADEVVTRYL